jgi:hypothetical protein
LKLRAIAAAAIAVFVVAVVLTVALSQGGDDPSATDSRKPTARQAKPTARPTPPSGAKPVAVPAGGNRPATAATQRPRTHPAPRHRGVEKAIWGPVTMPDGSSAFPIYQRLGVDVLEMPLRWADVAARRPANPVDPAEPTYSWPPQIERAIEEGERHGITVALEVSSTPGWANGGRRPIYAPENPSDFAVFLTAAANRYPQVHRWMIWDEPNRADRFQPNRAEGPAGPRAYAVLLDASYRALKNVSRRNVVISGPLFSGGDVRPPDFLRWMRLPDGRLPRLDWLGLDPYPFRPPDLGAGPAPGGYRDLSDLDTFAREVRRAYAGQGVDPPLWLAQFTIQSGQDSRYFEFHVGEDEQARWLRRGYEVAAAAGHVKGLGWYALLDQRPGRGSANWGLMSASAAPKPAFHAYRHAPGDG